MLTNFLIIKKIIETEKPQKIFLTKNLSKIVSTINDQIPLVYLNSDQVEIFDEDTPYQLIKQVNPDIIVKGGDYDGTVTDPDNPRYVVGSDLAAVSIFNIVEGYSTTNTLKKIKK